MLKEFSQGLEQKLKTKESSLENVTEQLQGRYFHYKFMIGHCYGYP